MHYFIIYEYYLLMKTNINKGLSSKEVIESRKKYGINKIESKNKNTFIKLVIESLGDPIIKILIIALAVKLLFLFNNSDMYETLGIVVAIFLISWVVNDSYPPDKNSIFQSRRLHISASA